MKKTTVLKTERYFCVTCNRALAADPKAHLLQGNNRDHIVIEDRSELITWRNT